MEASLRRLLDVGVALLGLALGAVPAALGALAIRLTSRGPVLFRSPRMGRRGVRFDLLKLRTMGDGGQSERITGPQDDRVTAIGRLLRRIKVDEIPQLWNVLVGDMALVGPRPEDVSIVVGHYTEEELGLLAVRPGLTSRVQVEWYPDVMYHLPPPPGISTTDYYVARILHPKLTLEARSLERRGLIEDLRVIALTVATMVRYAFATPPKREWPEEFR